MFAAFKHIRAGTSVWRRVGMAGFVAGVATLAFFWGRHGITRAVAQAPTGFGPSESPGSDYGRRVVAFIHGNVPITREDLGEYLIARFGAQRIEYLVNRRIIERACAQHRVSVTDAEVDAQLKEDLKMFGGSGVSEKDFVTKVLKSYNKTLYEWREDVIRPKLALAKFCQEHCKDELKVTEEDIQKAYEAHYGEKVECRMLVLPRELGGHKASEIWTRVKNSDAEFDQQASVQFIPQLAARKGAIPPIHKHFGDPKIEKETFALQKEGDVTPLLDMPDSYVILKLVKRIPAQTDVRLNDVRPALHKEMAEFKMTQTVPKMFQTLRTQANPNILLKGEPTPGEMERQVSRQLGMPTPPAPGGMSGH